MSQKQSILIPVDNIYDGVSISSPSGEGGEMIFLAQLGSSFVRWRVSISSPSGEGGEKRLASNMVASITVSISSPSGEGGERLP